jgi:hypothetical protein
MNAPRPPPPDTLINAADIEKNRYKFDPVVTDNIALPVELNGIVAIRQWKLEPGLFLLSGYRPRRFSSDFIWATAPPEPNNSSGIDAYPLLNYGCVLSTFSSGEVIGIVELAGRVIDYTGGIYRAECCRVLQLMAHTSLAARLSRIYGVPCVIADCWLEAGRKMVNWLSGHDGIRCLQWNLQLVSDLEAERLLSAVESLSDNIQQPLENDDIPEEQRDRGGWVSQYTNEVKLDYMGGVVVRNDAIKSKYPGGMAAFTFKHRCIYNNDFTVVKDEVPSALTTALADMADNSLPWHDLVISGRWGQLTSTLRQKVAFIAGCMLITASSLRPDMN